jgi:hypothetical protein
MEENKMEGMTYLAVAYFGMIIAVGLWTYTVVQRSRHLSERMDALEAAVKATSSEVFEE